MQLLNSLNKVKMRKSRIPDTLMIFTVTVQFREGNFLLTTQKLYLLPVREATIILQKRLNYIIAYSWPYKEMDKSFPRVT